MLHEKSRNKVNKVVGHVDADFAKDLDKSKSISSYKFMLNMCFISWKTSLQPIVSLTEVEFIVATEAVKEAKWLKSFLNELWFDQKII